jgi:hypothetical protein
LTTLRSIAAALRLRSEGHVSNLIRRCERDFGHDTALLASLDTTVALLRAYRPAPRQLRCSSRAAAYAAARPLHPSISTRRAEVALLEPSRPKDHHFRQ